MDINELNLDDINSIDMECKDYCDDDDGFCNFKDETLESEDTSRSINSKTGIIIDLSDSDYDEPKEDFYNDNINEIDMECSYYDEDDEFLDKEFVFEEKNKNKSYISSNKIEDDYWDKISKSHKASNKKGAYNTSFHFSGNPEKEMQMFNHDMTTNLSSIGSQTSEVSCCEELNNNYKSLFSNFLNIIGFEIIKNQDGTYTLIDLCDDLPNTVCKNKDDVPKYLQPYVNDCFIYPLQITTGEKYDSCSDWVSWYNNENREKYPKCCSDIEYCDLLANHINECF